MLILVVAPGANLSQLSQSVHEIPDEEDQFEHPQYILTMQETILKAMPGMTEEDALKLACQQATILKGEEVGCFSTNLREFQGVHGQAKGRARRLGTDMALFPILSRTS